MTCSFRSDYCERPADWRCERPSTRRCDPCAPRITSCWNWSSPCRSYYWSDGYYDPCYYPRMAPICTPTSTDLAVRAVAYGIFAFIASAFER